MKSRSISEKSLRLCVVVMRQRDELNFITFFKRNLFGVESSCLLEFFTKIEGCFLGTFFRGLGVY